MSLRLNDTAPDFTAETTHGKINFHEWIGDKWAILFSHPKDFTPVCTTELGYMAKIEPEFTKRHTKLIGLSVDPSDAHARWLADIEETQGAKVNYPIIADKDLAVSKLYGMLPAEEPGTSEGRTAATNQAVRNVYVIGPDKKIKLMLAYPMTTGRNFDEILRVVDSMQLTAKHKVATPANWKRGDDVIIAGSVNDDDAKKLFPKGWRSPKPYIRIVKQPGLSGWSPRPANVGSIERLPPFSRDLRAHNRGPSERQAASLGHQIADNQLRSVRTSRFGKITLGAEDNPLQRPVWASQLQPASQMTYSSPDVSRTNE